MSARHTFDFEQLRLPGTHELFRLVGNVGARRDGFLGFLSDIRTGSDFSIDIMGPDLNGVYTALISQISGPREDWRIAERMMGLEVGDAIEI